MRRSLCILSAALCAALGLTPGGASATSRGSMDVPDDTRVTLVQAGQGPRRLLRYRYRAGDAVELRMDMTMSMGLELAGRVMPPQTMPTMRMTAVLTVKAVSPGGDSTIELLLRDVTLVGTAGLSPAQQQQFVSAMGPLKGFRGTLLVTDRGVTKGMSYKAPAGLDPAAQQILQSLSHQMKQLSTPLPKEAVGVGATWRVVIPVKGPPLTMASQIELQVEAITPQGVRLGMKLTGWAPAQPLAIPGLAAVTARLKSLLVTGTGRMTLSLVRPLANGQMTAKQIMDAEFPIGANTQSMKMLMDMKVDIVSK